MMDVGPGDGIRDLGLEVIDLSIELGDLLIMLRGVIGRDVYCT